MLNEKEKQVGRAVLHGREVEAVFAVLQNVWGTLEQLWGVLEAEAPDLARRVGSAERLGELIGSAR